jgi:hypothetical protein
LLSGTKIALKRPKIFRQQKKPKIINELCRVGPAHPKFFGHENLVYVPTVYFMEENFGGPGFQPVPAPAKLSWPYLTTPEDEKCGQPPPAVLFQSRRGRLLHIVKGFFTVKPAATFFIRPNPLVAKNLPDTTGVVQIKQGLPRPARSGGGLSRGRGRQTAGCQDQQESDQG